MRVHGFRYVSFFTQITLKLQQDVHYVGQHRNHSWFAFSYADSYPCKHMSSCQLCHCFLSESVSWPWRKVLRQCVTMTHCVTVSERVVTSTKGEWKNNQQATPSPSPNPLQKWGVYFRRPHLQQAASLTDTVCLARTVIYWNSQGHTEIANTQSPQTSAKYPKSLWTAVT